MTDEIERARAANDLMRQLDREVFCGQLHMRNLPKAIGIIEDWLATLSSRGDAPTFEELKEIPQLRELAKMVTDNPCFTNAILAVTDAYKAGRASRGDAGTQPTWNDFDTWWEADGKFYDPDTDDVPWFDKRKELAEYAFIRAKRLAESALAHRETPEGGAPFAPLCQYCKQPLTPKVDCWACDRQSCTQCPDYRLAQREAPQPEFDGKRSTGVPRGKMIGAKEIAQTYVEEMKETLQANVAADRADREAKQEPAREWINAKFKLPPRHQNVLCRNADGSIFEGRICCGMHTPFFTYPRGDGNPSNTTPDWINVTHWMPLPAAPQPIPDQEGK